MSPAPALPTFFSRWPLLSFGLLAAFLSNFGQTFYIALFNPQIRAEFDLSHAQFGTLYSVATLASGLLLTYFGGLFDRSRTRTFAAFAFVVVSAASLTLAFASNVALLFAGLFLARFGGQGLLSLISTVTMARYFLHNRGKALAFASLGYPLGELVLPSLVVLALAASDWRTPWLASAGLMLLAIVPMRLLLANAERRMSQEEDTHATRHAEHQWTRAEALRDYRFYILMAVTVAGPFILTALFFHQAFLAESKGWTLAWIATSMVGYGLGHLVGLGATAFVVDRVGARRLLPYYLAPFGVGLFVLASSSALAAAPVYLSLAGLSMGAARNVGGAAVAEIYGVRHLGAIRSFSSMVFVLSTAAAPILAGQWIDAGIDFDAFVLGCALYVTAGSALAWLLRARFEPVPAGAAG